MTIKTIKFVAFALSFFLLFASAGAAESNRQQQGEAIRENNNVRGAQQHASSLRQQSRSLKAGGMGMGMGNNYGAASQDRFINPSTNQAVSKCS